MKFPYARFTLPIKWQRLFMMEKEKVFQIFSKVKAVDTTAASDRLQKIFHCSSPSRTNQRRWNGLQRYSAVRPGGATLNGALLSFKELGVKAGILNVSKLPEGAVYHGAVTKVPCWTCTASLFLQRTGLSYSECRAWLLLDSLGNRLEEKLVLCFQVYYVRYAL